MKIIPAVGCCILRSLETKERWISIGDSSITPAATRKTEMGSALHELQETQKFFFYIASARGT